MTAITDITTLLSGMDPALHNDTYVFCTVADPGVVPLEDMTGFFREKEGYTVIITKEIADRVQLPYTYLSACITLTVHILTGSSGLTATFSAALAGAAISCNVIAGYYHDHIFVAYADRLKAMEVLEQLRDASRAAQENR